MITNRACVIALGMSKLRQAVSKEVCVRDGSHGVEECIGDEHGAPADGQDGMYARRNRRGRAKNVHLPLVERHRQRPEEGAEGDRVQNLIGNARRAGIIPVLLLLLPPPPPSAAAQTRTGHPVEPIDVLYITPVTTP